METPAIGWLGFLSWALGKDEGMKSEKKKTFHKICCQKYINKAEINAKKD